MSVSGTILLTIRVTQEGDWYGRYHSLWTQPDPYTIQALREQESVSVVVGEGETKVANVNIY